MLEPEARAEPRLDRVGSSSGAIAPARADSTLRILHVIASGARRGAEMFAADLVSALDHAAVSQRVAILKGSAREVEFTAPVSVLPSAGTRVPGLRVDPLTLWSLRGVLRKERPEVVQAHGGEALKYAALAVAPRTSHLIYRKIGLAPRWRVVDPRRGVYRRLVRRASRVIAVGEALRREAMQVFGLDDRDVVAIPNAVDPARVRPRLGRVATRAALGIAPDGVMVLSLGAFTWEKDPWAQLEVAQEVVAASPGATFVMAGDGPLRREVEASGQSRGLAASFRFLGSREDAGDLLHASDVLFLTSRTEGMPAVAIEAGMAGVPVASFAVGGVPEIVQHGVTGMLAPPGDVRTLAAQIVGLLAEGDARREMGLAGMKRCFELFGIDTVAGQYLQVYAQLGRTPVPDPVTP